MFSSIAQASQPKILATFEHIEDVSQNRGTPEEHNVMRGAIRVYCKRRHELRSCLKSHDAVRSKPLDVRVRFAGVVAPPAPQSARPKILPGPDASLIALRSPKPASATNGKLYLMLTMAAVISGLSVTYMSSSQGDLFNPLKMLVVAYLDVAPFISSTAAASCNLVGQGVAAVLMPLSRTNNSFVVTG